MIGANEQYAALEARDDHEAASGEGPVDVSIVMPCLNEARTLSECISAARESLGSSGLQGEILVADNGSDDGSVGIALAHGARVVRVAQRGYGSALRGGISAARGRYIIMGDADQSYDLSEAPVFVEKLRDGYDLVVGNRFRGGIDPNAMPWSHRRIGNPVLSGLGRLFFNAPVGDFHCGLRGVTREAAERMNLRSPGMEFASEMVVKASLLGMRIAEVPTTLHRDGRDRAPHLRTWRDGWRHLRYMLVSCPRWLFLIPGILMMAAGAALTAWLSSGLRQVGPLGLGVQTLLISGFMVVIGYQLVVFAVFTTVLAVRDGVRRSPSILLRLFHVVRLETGLLAGVLMMVAGTGLVAFNVWRWARTGFGALDLEEEMRIAIPAVILGMLGVQTVFASFFLSILGTVGAYDAASLRTDEGTAQPRG